MMLIVYYLLVLYASDLPFLSPIPLVDCFSLLFYRDHSFHVILKSFLHQSPWNHGTSLLCALPSYSCWITSCSAKATVHTIVAVLPSFIFFLACHFMHCHPAGHVCNHDCWYCNHAHHPHHCPVCLPLALINAVKVQRTLCAHVWSQWSRWWF